MKETRSKRATRAIQSRWQFVALGAVLFVAACSGGAAVDETDPTPTGQEAAITDITTSGLPTVWKATPLTTVETEIEGGVRFDSTVRLDSEQLSVEGKVSQDVVAAEMLQGVVVDCLNTTFDEAFLWSATPPGVGEMNFGDSGSITFEFDAVVVTSRHMGGLGLAKGSSQRVCGEWSGTYAGASGALADAAGTFTAEFFGSAHDSTGTLWTFDA